MNENPFNKPFQLGNQDADNKKEQMKAVVEIAKPEDWERVRDLRLAEITGKDAEMFGVTSESIKEEKEMTEEGWKKLLLKKNNFIMLSRIGSEDVGMIRAFQRKGKLWHLAWAYIKDTEDEENEFRFRGKGLGKELYKTPLIEIQKRGGEKVTAFVRKDNVASIHLAEGVGFEEITDLKRVLKLLGKENIEEWLAMEADLTKTETK